MENPSMRMGQLGFNGVVIDGIQDQRNTVRIPIFLRQCRPK